ncbi:MAG: hypothetical protein GXY44_09215 [Phycisphaerales bacterium]|nr:hypothetical protein [Phycisphaerales bacterium]
MSNLLGIFLARPYCVSENAVFCRLIAAAGDVDMDDIALFQRCFSGNDPLPVDADEYCRCFDRNLDGKVNTVDLGSFEACSTGPGVQWVSSPACP